LKLVGEMRAIVRALVARNECSAGDQRPRSSRYGASHRPAENRFHPEEECSKLPQVVRGSTVAMAGSTGSVWSRVGQSGRRLRGRRPRIAW